MTRDHVPEFAVTTQSNDGVSRVAVTGEMDLFTTAEVRAALEETVRTAHPREVVVDLENVVYIDSSGLRLLLDAHHAKHYELRIAGVGPAVQRVLEVTGLDGILERDGG